MYTITKEITFEAAHRLPYHDGKCARLHGHSFKARIILQNHTIAEGGPKCGMLADFSEVKKLVTPLVEDKLDHHYLNESIPMENPTSENIARWLYDTLRTKLPFLRAVEVDETCTCSARYQRQI